jgi:hypothetical protein
VRLVSVSWCVLRSRSACSAFCVYSGTFNKGEMTGWGTKKWADGRCYRGPFVNGDIFNNFVVVRLVSASRCVLRSSSACSVLRSRSACCVLCSACCILRLRSAFCFLRFTSAFCVLRVVVGFVILDFTRLWPNHGLIVA